MEDRKPPPPSAADEWRSNVISRITFSWLTPLIRLGAKRTLEQEDMGALMASDEPADNADALERELEKRKNTTRALAHAFGGPMITAGLCKLFGDLLGFVPPLMLQQMVQFITEGSTATWGGMPTGYWFAIAMFVASALQNTLLHQHHHHAIRCGMRARSAIMATVYRKALRVPQSTPGGASSGQVVNLQQTDSESVMFVYYFIHYSWAAPLQTLIAVVLLYFQLSWAGLAGFFFMVLLVPAQKKLATALQRINTDTMRSLDHRVKLISEIVQGIRVLKFFAFEHAFEDMVVRARAVEVKHKRRAAALNAINTAVLNIGPPAVGLLTFAIFAAAGGTLSADNAFTTLALFDLLRLPLMVFPMLVETLTRARVAVERLDKFLDSPERVPYVTRGEEGGDPALWLRNATLSWGGVDEAIPTLRDVTVNFPAGQLTTVVGAVGAGKSSLLQALLGEMTPHGALADPEDSSSSVGVCGSVAYCAQSAWIMNASVRKNILFGREYDENRYRTVVEACALTSDFGVLPAGDQTLVGERGIALSGGQKQRISLARATYQDADVYILDDVLSAVDAHVARHIFTHCIRGVLQRKTVVLASHQLQFLKESAQVVPIEEGSVTGACAPDQLSEHITAVLQSEEHEGSGSDDGGGADGAEAAGEDVQVSVPGADSGSSPVPASGDQGEEDGKAEEEGEARRASRSHTRSRSRSHADGDGAAADKAAKAAHHKAASEESKEDREEGAVKFSVYVRYFAAAGLFWTVFLFSTVSAEAVAKVGTDWWLSQWSDQVGGRTVRFYLGVYAAITFFLLLTIALYSMGWVFASLRAATRLHNDMMHAILRCPASFFDTTPAGRIINRFSNDQHSIDLLLPRAFSQFLLLVVTVLSSILVQVAVFPLVAVAFLPLILLYYLIQQFYRRSSREIKRLDNISKSPVYSHLGESLAGLPTIRAYEAQQRFQEESEGRIAFNTRAFWKSNLINRWLGLRLDFLGGTLVLCTSLAAAASVGVPPGLAGLTLSYALFITGSLNWTVRQSAETEKFMASVERVLSFSALPSEAAWSVPEKEPAGQWPKAGAISMHNVVMRYRPELPAVLQGLTLDIAAGEKVGVCGRTGAGKSSVMLALFRIVELSEGTITIDGVDIGAIGLQTLRSKLAIIPQDPVLFSGTLRKNLDPISKHSDEELSTAVHKVQLDSLLERRGVGLDMDVAEGGENLSTGERQLVCMARALLRDAKILVLDEATASIDMGTDQLIQRMVRQEFKHCTVLTIAHRCVAAMSLSFRPIPHDPLPHRRINTILDSDRILVLDKGKVAEFDTPSALMQKEGSLFASLVKETESTRAAAVA